MKTLNIRCHCGDILSVQYDDTIEKAREIAGQNLIEAASHCEKPSPFLYDTKHAT